MSGKMFQLSFNHIIVAVAVIGRHDHNRHISQSLPYSLCSPTREGQVKSLARADKRERETHQREKSGDDDEEEGEMMTKRDLQ